LLDRKRSKLKNKAVNEFFKTDVIPLMKQTGVLPILRASIST
jgi:hypothetical protein